MKKNILTPLLSILAVFTLLMTGCASVEDPEGTPQGGAARTIEQIKESGEINIGTFSDKAPFGYVNSDGNYAGYDIEFGNRIGQDLGVKVNYVPVEAASRVEFLETGKVDIILANFTVTPERSEKVDFANPYMKVSLGLVSPSDQPITSVDEIANAKIIIVKGTTADTWLQAEHPDLQVQKFEQYTEVTNALLDGRGDAWITDNTEALAWSRQNDGFDTTITSFGSADTIAPAVQKGNDSVREWLNEELVKLGEEQFFHANFAKTLEPVYGDEINPDELVVEGGKA